MKQYHKIKDEYPDAILLFRVGDFYETFHDDAVKTSKILGIILTKRGSGNKKETKLGLCIGMIPFYVGGDKKCIKNTQTSFTQLNEL